LENLFRFWRERLSERKRKMPMNGDREGREKGSRKREDNRFEAGLVYVLGEQ
jgi:hypothetical protein